MQKMGQHKKNFIGFLARFNFIQKNIDYRRLVRLCPVKNPATRDGKLHVIGKKHSEKCENCKKCHKFEKFECFFFQFF